jgi:hypothetical protein
MDELGKKKFEDSLKIHMKKINKKEKEKEKERESRLVIKILAMEQDNMLRKKLD